MAYDEELADRIRELAAAEDGVTEKKMFGGLAFLVNGNLAVAASGQGGLLLRVEPGHTAGLLEKPHISPMVMRGKEMDGWLRVDIDGVRTKRDLQRWAGKGFSYARSLPPKR